MNSQQMVLQLLSATHQRVLRCLEDLSEDDAQRSPAGNLSPIIWQAGHLAFADARYAVRADRLYALPAAFEGLFKGGTGGTGAYPALTEVRMAFNTAQRAIEDVAKSVDLARPVDAQAYKNVGEMLMFACYHRGYHIGKMATLRALLGKPRLFG